MIKKIIERVRNDGLYIVRLLLRSEVIALSGTKVKVRDDAIHPAIRKHFYRATYEQDEVRILSQVLTFDDLVMEIGAGIGFLSSYCAQKVGDKKVYAYEANTRLRPIIEENYRLNKVSPVLINAILSENGGSNETFYVDSAFWSSSTHKRSTDAEKITVPTLNVNHEISKHNPSILVMDIEGGERELVPIINFAESEIRKFIIEIHPHVIGDEASSEVISKILSEGFTLDFSLSKPPVYYFYR